MDTDIYSPARVESWASQLRNESAEAGAVSGRLIRELEALNKKGEELNQKLIAARSQGLNLRPIYLLSRSLLMERGRVFHELSVNTAQSAALCRQSVDKAERLFGVSIKKRGDT